MSSRLPGAQSRGLAGRILMDFTPLKVSRDYRALIGGQLVSTSLTLFIVPCLFRFFFRPKGA